mmetsp:Transcript_9709/g.22357  ORF Transcript_9709/g.22357 Transcript_9709/m.22357 type:complete len:455 (+) Transcript_9709:189-1553(+)
MTPSTYISAVACSKTTFTYKIQADRLINNRYASRRLLLSFCCVSIAPAVCLTPIHQTCSLPQFPPQNAKSVLRCLGDTNRIVVENSCFLDNEVYGFGLLLSASPNIEVSNNFIDPIDNTLSCEFFATIVGEEVSVNWPPLVDFTTWVPTNVTGCLVSDAAECPLLAPTSAPSASPTTAPGFSICFSGRNTVEVKGKGAIRMKDLNIGDSVMVGDNQYEPVYSFGHVNDIAKTNYLQFFFTDSLLHRPLEISGDHMVFVEGYRAVPASSVQIRDRLILGSDTLELADVDGIQTVVRRGSYAPFTKSGRIVVNGILASSFVAFQDKEHLHIGEISTAFSYQWLARTFEAPHRLICHVGLCGDVETYTREGVSHWVHVPLKVSRWMLRQHPIILCLVFVPALIFYWFVSLIEALMLVFGLSTASWLLALLMVASMVCVVLRTTSVRMMAKKKKKQTI